MTEPKVLIIDDNPSDRALALRELNKLFPRLQYQEIIDEASFEAALERDNFNLVISDYQLGWITGLDILYRIKQEKPRCPVVMFTGTGSEEIAVSAMKAGLDDYVIKSPKHYIRLAAAVRSVWQRSQQQKALEEFKQSYYRFFERVPLGLYRLDPSGKIIEANSTLVAMLGHQQPKELQGKSMIEYHLQTEAYRAWQQQLGDSAVAEFEGQIESWQGTSIWVRHNAIAVKDERDRVTCYEGAVADISAVKLAELERAELLKRECKARESAESLNRIKDEFLATLSHELRTPLNAIIGWTQLLLSGKMNEAQTTKAIDVINRNAKAQNQLIDDLLDVSRIIRGTMSLQLTPIDPIEPVMAALDTVRPSAAAKNIQLISHTEKKMVLVNGDFERLQQVFWNLLINAIKFGPSGGRITIDSTVEDGMVAIKVTDTGQGITADDLPYVFDRFRQVETKSSTRTKGGLGLGLAIVRHLIEIHGGTVRANSPGLGKGSTFTVELPALQPLARPEAATSSSERDLALPSLAGLTLLVVEDEADAREMMTLILQQCGAKTLTADSVERALRLHEQHQPDLLISDISMPIKDGYSLIKQIRQTRSSAELPAIALTAYARSEDKQRAIQAGFDVHLPKPIEPMQLIELVLELMQ